MRGIVDLLSANTYVLIAALMTVTGVTATAYVLVRQRKLVKSPVFALVAGAPLYAALVAFLFSRITYRYGIDPVAMSWANHLLLQLAGASVFAAITIVMARNLPRELKELPRLTALLRAAPWTIASGYVSSTLVLVLHPTLSAYIVMDTSLWGFVYRSLLYLPPLLFGSVFCALWLVARVMFGKPATATEVALKKRFIPTAVGSLSWALLYLNFWSWPLVMLLWPESVLGSGAETYREKVSIGIFLVMGVSYLVVLLLPYRPSGLLHSMKRFDHYRLLTETLSFQLTGFLGKYWMVRYKLNRANRLMELAAKDLGLGTERCSNASTLYAIVALIEESRLKSSGIEQLPCAGVARSDLENLSMLHDEFIREPGDSPRKEYALANRYAPLLPAALLIASEGSNGCFYEKPYDTQLAAVAVADLLLQSQKSGLLDVSSRFVETRVFEAYARAKKLIDARRAS